VLVHFLHQLVTGGNLDFQICAYLPPRSDDSTQNQIGKTGYQLNNVE
jgi:hypothetical protein